MDQVPAGEVDLAVEGMTCASCVARVERALRQVPGVAGVAVNLATEQARVVAPRGVAGAELLAALHRAGYEGHVLPPEAPPPATRQGEGWRVLLAALLSAPLLAGMGAHLSGHGWMPSPWLQLLLATLV